MVSIASNVLDEISGLVVLTDRVKKRKDEYMAATPHPCAVRSRLITESWKETEGEPLDVRRAKLFKKIMEGLPVVIRDGELVVGSQTKYVRGAGPWRRHTCLPRLWQAGSREREYALRS